MRSARSRRPSGSSQLEAAGIPAGPINRSARRWRTCRRSIARWCGRSPECRWSARRCGSTASARTATCRRRRSASIRSEVLASAWARADDVERLRPRRSSARPNPLLRDLARAFDQQVELLLAAVLDQHLRGADEVAGRAGNGDEVEAALLAGVRPLDLIAGAVLDRQRGRPGCQRTCPRPRSVPASCRPPSGSGPSPRFRCPAATAAPSMRR